MTTLTAKQERFCLNLFQGMNQSKAYVEAGYICKNLNTVKSNACRLAKNADILQRLAELKQQVAHDKVMTVQERLERLSEIARTNLTDFMELGQDGTWVNLGKDTPKTGAIQEIHSRTEYDDNGSHPTIYTSVKLHDPLKAIDLLNRMDKVYSDSAIVNIDNRKTTRIYNIIVPETKSLLEKLEHEGRVESDPDISQEPKQLPQSATPAIT
jgi:phage terminase small subunit